MYKFNGVQYVYNALPRKRAEFYSETSTGSVQIWLRASCLVVLDLILDMPYIMSL